MCSSRLFLGVLPGPPPLLIKMHNPETDQTPNCNASDRMREERPCGARRGGGKLREAVGSAWFCPGKIILPLQLDDAKKSSGVALNTAERQSNLLDSAVVLTFLWSVHNLDLLRSI